MNIEQHLMRQMAFSRATFGPGTRTKGVIDHIRKELKEVEEAEGAAAEWVDIVILGLDGLTRQLAFCNEGDKRIRTSAEIAEEAWAMIVAKQDRNENRVYPDWRTMSADKAIEHDRSAGEGHIRWTWYEDISMGRDIWVSSQAKGFMVCFYNRNHGFGFVGPLKQTNEFRQTRIDCGNFYGTMAEAHAAAQEHYDRTDI